MKLKRNPTPVKPTVVGDRLFTNTSKRWISTANLREDMRLMKSYNYLDSAKRTTGQAHDYNMQVFRDIWRRKLDKSKLTKRPEKRKEQKTKKEVAAYLRDVYSSSSSEEENEDLSLSVSTLRKMGKKKAKKKVSGGFSDLDEDALAEEEEDDDLSSRGISSPFVMSSLASLSKYMPDQPPTPEPEPLGKARSVKSAGEIKQPQEEPEEVPALRHRLSRSTSLIRPRHSLLVFTPVNGSSTPARAEGAEKGTKVIRTDREKGPEDKNQPAVPTITETQHDTRSPDKMGGDVADTTTRREEGPSSSKSRDESNSAYEQLRVKPSDSPTASSVFSVNTVDSASFDLNRLHLSPKAVPPIYTLKPRKLAVRDWDYPFAGVGSNSPDITEESSSAKPAAGEKLYEQLADLRYCRYLRLPPSKQARRRLEQQQERARRKETVYVVAAGRQINVDKKIFSVVTESAAGKWMRKTGIPVKPLVKPTIIEVVKKDDG